jgi:2-methylcitrate dehydratase PrpD
MPTLETKAGATAIALLADFVAGAQFEPTAQVSTTVRAALIDTLGCILVGAREPVARRTREALVAWGTGPGAVFGTGLGLAPPWAALANAVAGHALDLDDWELPGNTHPSVVMFPALLAMAAERPVSGAAIVEAYLVGFEVIARLGEAINFEHYDRGWHTTATLGPIGAAAVVSRLIGLDREASAHALSFAVSQASGYTCQFGSNAKPLQAGFAAKTGIVSALLAMAGLTGQPHVLDSPTGFNALMAQGDKERFADALVRLGNPLALAEHGLVMKAYPACGYTHRLVDCALDIHAQPGFDAREIKRVTASLPDFHAAILPFHAPTKRTEALFSAPFCVALALLRGHVGPSDFDGRPWEDPTIKKLSAMIAIEERRPKNPALNYDPDDPDWLRVQTAGGCKHYAECAFPLGSPRNPMSFDQIVGKFETNAGIEAGELEGWVEAADIRQLLERFRGPS